MCVDVLPLGEQFESLGLCSIASGSDSFRWDVTTSYAFPYLASCQHGALDSAVNSWLRSSRDEGAEILGSWRRVTVAKSRDW